MISKTVLEPLYFDKKTVLETNLYTLIRNLGHCTPHSANAEEDLQSGQTKPLMVNPVSLPIGSIVVPFWGLPSRILEI